MPKIGFMYDGVLLDEDNPDQLLSRYDCRSLENVFLHLCQEYIKKRKTFDVSAINELSKI